MKTNRKRCHQLIILFIALLSLYSIVCYLQLIEYENAEYENNKKGQGIPTVMPSIPINYVLEVRDFIASSPKSSNANQWEFYNYNVLQSNKIGAYRTLLDTRNNSCIKRPYNINTKHSRVSVIIAFHNEARSTLLRTIMSLYYRTSPTYLHELILIDDFSEDAYLLTAMLRLKLPPFLHNFPSITNKKSSASNLNSNMNTNTHTYKISKSNISHVKVRIARNRQRLGVIASRNRGAHLATGDYLFFLDSHCEVNVGWLEPLLERITRKIGTDGIGGTNIDGGAGFGNMIAVSSILDSIDADSFEYIATSANLMGGFDWNLHFHWIPRQSSKLTQGNMLQMIQQNGIQHSAHTTKEKTEYSWNKISKSLHKNEYDENMAANAFKSPAIAGGVFLISRDAFFKLNGFNPMLETWGGESLEFSIKCWLCGGHIEIVPCSRVGHIFRKTHSFQFPNDSDSKITYLRNSKIIAETWLDDYKYFFYSSKPAASHIDINITDIQRSQQLKRELQCRPFSWYLQHIFPQLKLPNNDFIAYGTLSSSKLCLHITNDPISVKDAIQLHMSSCYQSNVTHWYLHRQYSQLQTSFGYCLNVVDMPTKHTTTLNEYSIHLLHFRVVLEQCTGNVAIDANGHNLSKNQKRNQIWLRRGGLLVHQQTQLCLDNPLSDVVTVSHCRNAAPSQLFRFTMELQQL